MVQTVGLRYKGFDFAYNAMKQDSSLITTTGKAQFMSQTEQENIGLLSSVNDSLNAGNLSEASTINTIVMDTNLIETNKKTVNDIIISTKQNGFISGTDSATLESISNQNPLAGGKGVYQAGAILRKRVFIGSSQLRKVNPLVSKLDGFYVYPNPSSGTVFIKSANAATFINEIKLYDVTGRLLISKKGDYLNYYKLDLSILVSGSYIVSISDNFGNVSVKQIVLTK